MIPLLLIGIGDGGAVAIVLAEGLEYTAPVARAHFTAPNALVQYSTPEERMHYEGGDHIHYETSERFHYKP